VTSSLSLQSSGLLLTLVPISKLTCAFKRYRNISTMSDIEKTHSIFEEALRLQDFCQCDFCAFWKIDPRRWYGCRCCYGCLKSNKQTETVLNKTKEYFYKKANEAAEYVREKAMKTGSWSYKFT